jgi:DNA polymerase-4
VGEDDRTVTPDAPRKSISVETTFARDTGARAELLHELAPLCERLAERLRQAGVAAGGATLKLKTADFRLRSRSKRLDPPTQRAEALFHAAAALLERELDGSRFRLIGIGSDDLVAEKRADPPGLFDGLLAETRADAALDAARRRHGPAAVRRARQLDQ